jgi:hypothetical protein
MAQFCRLFNQDDARASDGCIVGAAPSCPHNISTGTPYFCTVSRISLASCVQRSISVVKLEPRLPPVAVPILAKRGFAGAQVVANARGQEPSVLRGPLFREQHVVVRRAPERMRVALVGAGVPELEAANRDVTPQGVGVTRRNRPAVLRVNETSPQCLRAGRELLAQGIPGVPPHHVQAIHPIQARLVQGCMIEKHPPEVVR